ncbi:MAG: hypothetical protein AB8G17_10155 [Gammaproteobacteria bacterium]
MRRHIAALAAMLLGVAPGGLAQAPASSADATPAPARVAPRTLATDPLGFKRLRKELGQRMPTGEGVVVAQIEPPSGLLKAARDAPERSHAPDRSMPEFDGVRFGNARGIKHWGSAHATITARRFYGRKRSFAPGITDVYLYTANAFLSQLGRPESFAPARVWSHSWIGSTGSDGGLLRALDRNAERYEWLVVTGLANRGENSALLSSAFNVLSVGRSDGAHAAGAARVDRVYSGTRDRPHIVAPATTVSEAVPIVSSAAAFLIDAARQQVARQKSPRGIKTIDERHVVDGARALTVRAALMAGASRSFAHELPLGYREDATVRTDNGLDTRFGAGQLNVYNSYQIIAGGQTDSVEDDRRARPLRGSGFDVDDSFGGNGDAHARYRIAPGFAGRLTVALTWPVSRAGVTSVDDINLLLYDVTEKTKVVASSSGKHDTTENLTAELDPQRRYEFWVVKSYTESFDLPYAVAWRLTGEIRK